MLLFKELQPFWYLDHQNDYDIAFIFILSNSSFVHNILRYFVHFLQVQPLCLWNTQRGSE